MIEVIAFDLDDTLWAVAPIIINAEKVLDRWLRENSPDIRYSVTAMRELRHELLREEPGLANRITEFRRRIIQRALELSGTDITSAEKLSTDAMDVFLAARNEIVFFDGAMDAIKELAGTYTLGALTNGNADISRLGLDEYFSFAFSAEEVGAPKPATNLFRRALEHTGTTPEQMVYVGDDPVLDIDPANQMGLHTVLLKNPSKPGGGATDADIAIDRIGDLPDAIARLHTRRHSRPSP